MENRRAWIWSVRGFALTWLILLVAMMMAGPSMGWAQGDGPRSNREALIPGGASPPIPEPRGDDTPGGAYTSPLVIPAADFSSDGMDPDGFYFSFTGGYVDGSGTACLKAPAYLPNGATVVSVYATVYDNATGTVAVNLRRADMASGTSVAMATLGTVSDSTSLQQPSDTTISYPTVSYPGYAYYVTTCLDAADHRLYSVRIYYTGP